MNKEQTTMKIAIYDKEKQSMWLDEDGETLLFLDETAARNFIFTEGYTEDFLVNKIKFIVPKEEVLQSNFEKHCPALMVISHDLNTAILSAMEEYANQFKNQQP